MADSDQERTRVRLIVPIGTLVAILWASSGFTALVTGDIQVFVIASAPFGVFCGFLFGGAILNRERR